MSTLFHMCLWFIAVFASCVLSEALKSLWSWAKKNPAEFAGLLIIGFVVAYILSP